MHYSAIAMTLAASLLLGGCGQMGPLYQPQEPGTSAVAPATPGYQSGYQSGYPSDRQLVDQLDNQPDNQPDNAA